MNNTQTFARYKKINLRCIPLYYLVLLKGLLFTIASLFFYFIINISSAHAYPTKPIRLINPFPPGGAGDAVARIVFENVGSKLGQPFFIDSIPGAGGIIGTSQAAKALNDGYTLVLATSSTFAVHPATQKSLPYDISNNFDPISMLVTMPYLLIATNSAGFLSVKNLVSYAKANPWDLNFGSFGIGTSSHLAYEMFARETGIKLTHIPYKGSAPLISALLTNDVQTSMDLFAAVNQHLTNDKLIVLGVASRKRLENLPQVPTLIEQGYPVEAKTFFAVFGPKGIPSSVVRKLNAEINNALVSPKVAAKLISLGAEIVGGAPDDLVKVINSEQQQWKKIVVEGGFELK